jgi:NADH-quinone oxidoreductase subunit L
LLLAVWLYVLRPALAEGLASRRPGALLHRFWFVGWGFDWLYSVCFVQPLVFMARLNRGDFIDLFYRLVAGLSRFGSRLLGLTQTGRVRWYAAGVACGAIVVVAIMVLS